MMRTGKCEYLWEIARAKKRKWSPKIAYPNRQHRNAVKWIWRVFVCIFHRQQVGLSVYDACELYKSVYNVLTTYMYTIMPTNQITYFTEWIFTKTKRQPKKYARCLFICVRLLFDSCNLVHDTRQYQINKFNVTITILVSSAVCSQCNGYTAYEKK